MSTPNDTTVVLNPGAGGDTMDASVVTQQGTGSATAKRQRVVISGDKAGSAVVDPTTADPGASPVSVPALAVALVSDKPEGGYVDGELRPLSISNDGRLRVLAQQATTTFDFFGDAGPLRAEPQDIRYTTSTNPWGT